MIRTLTEEDAKTFAALRLEGIALFPEAFLLTEAEAAKAPIDAVERFLSRGTMQGCFDGERLVGFIGMDTHFWSMTTHRAHIGPFYVTPSHQGRGTAFALMDAVEQRAADNGVTQLELWVASGNTRARAFYTGRGFRKTGDLPAAVLMDGTPQSDVFMLRDLTDPLPLPGGDGLRRLGPLDWRLYHEIRSEALTTAPKSFGSTLREWKQKAPDDIADGLRRVNFWAVVHDGRVVSAAGWHRMPGAVQAHRGHIVGAYTRPEARGQGHFAAIMAKIIDEARAAGMAQLELDVGSENAPARAAYQRLGFEVTGTIPGALNHDGHIHNQLYMVRPL
ncbi:GNAT family N-acetyltransferase [Gymnodinialimonas sp. 2305UL16-5]|uniref:GNAT family N-acetyltransferase n=1 Tax=Gymnodinialimonas mytili TaxID=3126503 RepID=UPI0030A275B1